MAGHDVIWLRYWMTGFFAAFGVFMIVKRGCFGSASSFTRMIDVSGDLEDRFDAARRLRTCDEALPSAAMGMTIGCIGLALALGAALTNVSLGALYALLASALAIVLTFAYLRLRSVRTRSYAALDVRDARAVAPPYVWALAAVATVTPLVWLRSDPVVALIVTVSGVVILVLANRVAAMPALLHGDDVTVERFVDIRLREGRTSNLLAIAVAPGYVFEAFTGQFVSDPLVSATTLIGLIAVLITNYRLAVVMRKSPSETERSAWLHATI